MGHHQHQIQADGKAVGVGGWTQGNPTRHYGDVVQQRQARFVTVAAAAEAAARCAAFERRE